MKACCGSDEESDDSGDGAAEAADARLKEEKAAQKWSRVELAAENSRRRRRGQSAITIEEYDSEEYNRQLYERRSREEDARQYKQNFPDSDGIYFNQDGIHCNSDGITLAELQERNV